MSDRGFKAQCRWGGAGKGELSPFAKLSMQAFKHCQRTKQSKVWGSQKEKTWHLTFYYYRSSLVTWWWLFYHFFLKSKIRLPFFFFESNKLYNIEHLLTLMPLFLFFKFSAGNQTQDLSLTFKWYSTDLQSTAQDYFFYSCVQNETFLSTLV